MNDRLTYGALIAVLAVIMLAGRPAMAGGESDARSIGLARSGMAVSDNTEAFFWNPANLGYVANQKKNKLVVDIFSFGFRVSNNIVGIPQYNKYNGKTWSDKDKKDILDLFGSDSHLDFNGEGESRIGVRYLNYSFNIYVDGYGFARAPKELFEVALRPGGYHIGAEAFNARASGAGHAGITFAASAGFSVKKLIPTGFDDLTVGATVKYVRGLYQATLKDAWVVVEESDTLTTRGRYDLLSSQGGNGFGLDLGFGAKLNKSWTVGLSFQNLLNTFSWSSRNERRYGTYETRTNNLIDIKDNTSNDTTAEMKTGSYSTYHPIIARLGVAYQLDKRILLVGQYEHFLRTKYVGKPSPRLAAGAEFQTSRVVVLRTGASLGGDNRGFNLAGGVGFFLGKWIIDVGTNSLEGFILLRRLSFSTSVRLIIR